MPSRFLRLIAGSTLLRAQAIRGIATPMRGIISARSQVQLAVAAAGPLRISYPASRALIPRATILRAFATSSNKDIPPCGKQCTCNYDSEKESMIKLQRCTILCFAGNSMYLAFQYNYYRTKGDHVD